MPSSRDNDWPSFATANAEWVTAYKKLYGQEPPQDETDQQATRWFTAIRPKFHGGKKYELPDDAYRVRSDDQRSKTNEYRRAHRAALIPKMLPAREQ
jgi:hypothetical protein